MYIYFYFTYPRLNTTVLGHAIMRIVRAQEQMLNQIILEAK
jgi:hypothetical protein